MKKAFIYFSLTGNGDFVASKISQLGYDIIKVETKHKMPKKGLGLFLGYGFIAFFNKKMKLANFNFHQDDYEEIIIGSPIWNGRLSCPINTVLDSIDKSKIKNFILFSGSGEGKPAIKRITKKFPKAHTVILKEPKKYNEELKKLSF